MQRGSFAPSGLPPSKHSQHFSAFLSLAAKTRDELLENADPHFANFIRNVRDYDVGLQTMGTRYIGRGGTFTVRRTIDPTHRPVIFKSTLRGKHVLDETTEFERLNSILLELRILSHPPVQRHQNVVDLLQIGWEGDALDPFLKWPVLVMEYADQGTLEDFFDHVTVKPVPEWRKICFDVANGLLAVHKCGISHGDLKLENVLVCTDEVTGSVVAKLSDFGGAILDGESLENSSKATPPWTAPEWKETRERQRHQKSDVYALALLIWRVALSGADPFQDNELFALSNDLRERNVQLDAEKQLDEEFLQKAIRSVSKMHSEEDSELIGNVFGNSLRTQEQDRSLQEVILLLKEPTDGISEKSSETSSDDETDGKGIKQEDSIPFSFAGSEYTPLTMTLYPKILESMAYALNDKRPDRKIEAAIGLAMMNLAGDDFGLHSNITRGLNFLTLAAALGSDDHRVLVYRMHKAFEQPIPETVAAQVTGWLVDGASRGSLVAAEDLEELNLLAELDQAQTLLKSRYCGIGTEILKFDDEAHEILLSSDNAKTYTYLAAQTAISKAMDQDWSCYLLNLASAYGNTYAVEVLLRDFGSAVDETNGIGDTAIHFAARSGHAETLETLLRWGSNASLGNQTGETALHWLCAFNDEDMPKVGRALADANVDLDAIAEEFNHSYRFIETEYISGTPLHRAVARNNVSAVQVLLDLGADPFSLGGEDQDTTPFMLAVLLHYPHIIRAFISKIGQAAEFLTTPEGLSILTTAIEGGTLFGSTFGRLIRHGHKMVPRAEETLKILFDLGASEHFSSLPGLPNCTATYFASQSCVSILNLILKYGGKADIDKPATRAVEEEEDDDDSSRPPLFEAITFGKIENVNALLDHGADPLVRHNSRQGTSILYQCALAGFQDTSVLMKIVEAGVGVDDTPEDDQTPFVCAVLNRSFVIAEFLRDHGADVNALFRNSLTGRSILPTTVLRVLLDENSPGSLACIEFLFRDHPGWSPVDLLVEPASNTTVFHILAGLSGDDQDGSNTRLALDLCWSYFDPTSSDINMVTSCIASESDSSSPGTLNAIDRGGNTMLHLAVISANVEAVRYILVGSEDIDTTIENGIGLTALELAEIIYSNWETRWQPRDIPKHTVKQKDEARRRREAIISLLRQHTPIEARQNLLERFDVFPATDE